MSTKASDRYPPDWKASVERNILERADFDGPGGCWVWTGSISPGGYGRIKFAGVVRYMHRLSLEAALGERLADGFQVDHLCRNPPCVRPSHLEPVTPAVNTRRGKKCRLYPNEIREMRALRLAGWTVVALGQRFGVNPSHVSRVCRNLRYVLDAS